MMRPSEIIDEHADDIHKDIVPKAKEYAKEWDEWRYGKSPVGGAAAATYIAYHRHAKHYYPTQNEIAELFGTSAVTIRNRLKEFDQ